MPRGRKAPIGTDSEGVNVKLEGITADTWRGWRRVGAAEPSEGLCRPGIIALVNTATGKAYVASTSNMSKRFYDERRRLQEGRHPCPILQRDFTTRPTNFD